MLSYNKFFAPPFLKQKDRKYIHYCRLSFGQLFHFLIPILLFSFNDIPNYRKLLKPNRCNAFLAYFQARNNWNVERIQPSKNQLIRIGVIGAAMLVLLFIPFDRFSESQSICIHYNLLGVQCPLCGMTRAVHQFLHFRFASALHYNLVVLLLPLYLLIDVLTCFFHQPWLVLIRKLVVIMIFAALILLYAYRIATQVNWG